MLATLLPVGASPAVAAAAFVETFDDSSGFVTNVGFFSDGSGDYFGLTGGSTSDFGVGADPTALKAYTGFDGSFMTGMDLDDEGATLPIVVTWTGIDITGLSNLEFAGDFAEFFDDPGDIDPTDFIRLAYQIDGGGYTQLLWFSGADFSSSVNGIFRDDTDFDGLGDGAPLGNAAATFEKPIPGSGAVLDLQLTVSLDAGDEDFAVDNFVIEEGGAPSGPADVLINEVDADQVGTDSAEFVELYDGGVGNTALDGLVVVFFNGSNDASYESFDLDGYTTGAGGYFVLCGDAANTANCDLDVLPDTNLIQNGADAVAVFAGDASDFPDGTAVTTVGLIDALVYDTDDSDDAGLLVLLNAGQPQVNERDGGDGTGHSNQRCPDGLGGARNTDTYSQYAPTPGAENVCEDPVVEVKIHDVQGDGLASPLVGQTVIIEGIVVGDYQDDVGTNGDLNGFFVQEEDADTDANPLTSEGIFVFNGSDPTVDVNLGDLVRVEGSVSEFFDKTQITSFSDVAVVSSGNPLPTPAIVTLPYSDVADLEAFEGMSVLFPQSLVIAEYFNFDRFGEMVLTTERAPQPTAVYEPGSVDAQNLATSNALSRITLDDGRTSQNPDPALHPNGAVFDLTNRFRGGDTITNLPGVMDFSFGNYKVQPTTGGTYDVENPRQLSPDPVGSDLTVATFNVLNYFTTLDDSGEICGPLENQGCRGADDADEFTRQRDKIIDAIVTMDADVVGLVEIENHPTDAALDDLVAGLNDVAGPGTYAAVTTGPVGPDVIKVALIYQPANVSPQGGFAVLDTPAFLDPNNLGDDKNRAALAQSFVGSSSGGVFTVAVNHLKSKGSGCGAGDDDPEQGSCNLTRTLAAQELADWLQTDPTGSGDADFLIIGDLNSYDKEDPIDALKAGGYVDLILRDLGEFAYSYVFSGQWGYLDYIMANGSMESQVTGTTIWHINADEPDILNYDTSFKKDAQDLLYEPNAFRSSDHDPVIVGLELTATPLQAKTHAVDVLEALLPTGDRWDDWRIRRAAGLIEASLNPAYWVDDNHLVYEHLNWRDGRRVFDKEWLAVKYLRWVDGSVESDLDAVIGLLVGADLDLARTAIAEAEAAGGNAYLLKKAEREMARAEDDLNRNRPDRAIRHYKRAWLYANWAYYKTLATKTGASAF